MVRLCARQQNRKCIIAMQTGPPWLQLVSRSVSRVLLLLVSVDIRVLVVAVVRGVFFSGALSLLLMLLMLLYGGVVSQARASNANPGLTCQRASSSPTPIFAMPAVVRGSSFRRKTHNLAQPNSTHNSRHRQSTVVVRDRCNQDRSGSTNHVRMYASD